MVKYKYLQFHMENLIKRTKMRLKEVGLYKEKLHYFLIVIRQPFHYIIIVQPNRLEGFSVLLVATSWRV